MSKKILAPVGRCDLDVRMCGPVRSHESPPDSPAVGSTPTKAATLQLYRAEGGGAFPDGGGV